MNIIVNDEPLDFHGTTIDDLLGALELPQNGVAVAHDADIISRDEWSTFHIEEGMKFIVIKAACGG